MKNIILSIGIMISFIFPQKSYAEMDGFTKFVIGVVGVAAVAGAISRSNEASKTPEQREIEHKDKRMKNCTKDCYREYNPSYYPSSYNECWENCKNNW